MNQLEDVQDKFIHHWGTLGSSWGVNKTMTQIHALLMVTDDALTTDDLMDRLKISRGNAHSNVKELVNWGIAKQVIIPGARKDYYTAEKEPWKLLCTVARERKRREIEPAIEAIADCLQDAKTIKTKAAKEFREQLSELQEFLQMADKILSKVGRSERSKVLKWMMTLL